VIKMTSFAEGLISAKDFSLTFLLPAILVFIIFYAILAKIKILGENQWVNSILSAIVAILFVAVAKAVSFTNEFMPLIAMAFVVILFLFVLFKFVGVEAVLEGNWGKGLLVVGSLILVLILTTVAFKKVFTGSYDRIVGVLNSAWQAIIGVSPETTALIIMFAAIILSAWLMIRKG